MAVKKDIDSLIKDHLNQVKKLKEKKFQMRFKNLFKTLEKYQDKISDEDIERLTNTLIHRYGAKVDENKEENRNEI